MRMNVRRRKADALSSRGAAHHRPFDAIRPAEHTTREIHTALQKEFANARRADSFAAQAHLRNFIGNEPELFADAAQQINVAFTVMTEEKSAPEIHLFRVQTIDHDIAQEILGANL